MLYIRSLDIISYKWKFVPFYQLPVFPNPQPLGLRNLSYIFSLLGVFLILNGVRFFSPDDFSVSAEIIMRFCAFILLI